MPSEGQADGASSTTGSGDGTTLVPNHLASLVPSFDPSKDDLVAYAQEVQLLLGMWPDNKWTELATRLNLEYLRISLHEAPVATGDFDSQREKVDTTHSGSFGRPLGPNQPRKTVRVR